VISSATSSTGRLGEAVRPASPAPRTETRSAPITATPRVAVFAGRSLVADAIAALLRESGLMAEAHTPELEGLWDAEAAPDAAVLLDDLGQAFEPTLAALREAFPGVRALVLAGEADAASVSRAVEIGMHGLVDGHAGGRELAQAVRQVVAGRRVFPVCVVLDEPAAAAVLSSRQRDVLRLVAQGLSNQAIATELTISVNTVKFHVRTVFRTLGIHNRVEAARLWAAADARGHLFG
jgi:two-component system response regulator DesR